MLIISSQLFSTIVKFNALCFLFQHILLNNSYSVFAVIKFWCISLIGWFYTGDCNEDNTATDSPLLFELNSSLDRMKNSKQFLVIKDLKPCCDSKKLLVSVHVLQKDRETDVSLTSELATMRSYSNQWAKSHQTFHKNHYGENTPSLRCFYLVKYNRV